MLKKPIYFIFIFLLFANCHLTPGKIALGEWKYKLYLNGRDVGTAVMSTKIAEGNYVSTSELNLTGMSTFTKDVIVETIDFRPVRLESYTKVSNGKMKYENNIVSKFNGREVELNFGDKKVNYTINRDFIIEGGYFMDQLIKAKFKKGFEITNYVYNPSVELDTPIKATTKIAGYENIIINGTEEKLCHIVQSIENIKDNVDIYIDDKCVMRKGIIRMLNLKFELVIIQ